MKIMGIVVSCLMMVVTLVAYQSVLEESTRRYGDDIKFTNIEDALDFQRDLVMEANNLGAKITKSDLTLESPPIVSFIVVMPPTKVSILGDESLSFKYGKQWITNQEAKRKIITGFILMPSITILLMWLLLFSKWVKMDSGE